jgi:hypothetical protein
MPSSDRVIADAEALLQRVSPEGRRLAQRARSRRNAAALKVGRRLAVATLAVIATAIVYALVIGPIGVLGFAGALLAMVVAWGIILFASHVPEETPERLLEADIAQLPARTETWLQTQRPALPAPAARLVDSIGLRLEALQPQLVGLDPREPAAHEVRKLIAEELPELIQGYARVPQPLRKQERNGIIPDRQLVEGLTVVEGELARMSADLASGDLHKFATQQRYLELKYRDGGAE